MKETVDWTSSRLAIRLLNLKRPQLNRVVQVLTGHCNLQRHKKTTGRAESSLCPKCSLEDETPNHHVGNCKVYQDIRVKYFGTTKTTVHNVQRWSPRGRPWPRGRPRGHILKSLALASKVKFLALALASRPQVLENWSVLGSRTALFFGKLKFCGAVEKFFGKRFFVEIA